MCDDEAEIDENSPVSDDESILRRIVNSEDYYNASLEVPVTPTAFRPTSKDTSGISIYRRKFVEPQNVANAGTNPNGYYVAQLDVSDINQKGVTAIPVPLDETDPSYLPGHSEIPEINCEDYKASKENKKKIKALQVELAILASKDIIYTP